MSFLTDYFGIVEGAGEVAVCCPFDHYTGNGLPYKETNPSAHVNTLERLFHCKVCGIGYSEAQFLQQIYGCSYMNAKRLQRCFDTPEDRLMWNTTVQLTEASKERLLSLGISEQIIQDLNIRTPNGTADLMAFPVFMHGHLMDIRTYNPGAKPKVRSRANATAGLIIPYDDWVDTPLSRVTLICAGEKDMAIARTHGFNAITITGGENTLPILMKSFAGRSIAIVYDNDGAGIAGAKRLAVALLEHTSKVKVVTGFHEICKESGEDITDFFVKYGKTKQDLIQYIESAPIYTPTEEDLQKRYPLMDLLTASSPNHINKLVQSNIQVVAVSEATFAVPAGILARKYRATGDKDTMQVGDFREWELTKNNIQDILHLIDNNFKEDTVNKNIKGLLRIPFDERCVKVEVLMKKTVFKAYVTDLFETTTTQAQPMEFTVYSVGHKLESGKKYMATYKLVPHPYKGQQLIMIIVDVQEANDSVSKFTITPEVKQHLNIIRNLEGSVADRINLMTEKVKGLIGYDGNNILIQAIDLSFHTALQFHFGTFKDIRGYLDTLIVGESRTGKSSTSDTLRKVYGLGVFTSLAGNSATVPGLIGGSNKTANGYQTRAGIIPQNHRGLIIFEEFGKSHSNVVTELTDIRSSNEVRITRVSGTLTLPAMVRMISLTNVKSTDGTIKSIASYPNGISIITELVGTAEDIARYDLLVVLSDRGANQIDPFWQPQEPFSPEIYRTRIRWIWSRTPEQILIDREVGLYVIEKANQLNQEYECHIKIFGTEAWKKICRLAIAVAGYLVSCSDDYNSIVVTKDHVDFAVQFLKNLYDNPTFKLKEYVEHEKRYSIIDDDAVAALQEIFNRSPSLVMQLEQSPRTSKNMLSAATGMTNDELNRQLNRLTSALFIRFANHDIIPTERFRLGLAKINRETFVRRVGEPNA